VSGHPFGDFAETIGVCTTCGVKPCVCAYPPINYQVDATDAGADPPNVPGDKMTWDQANAIEAWQTVERNEERIQELERRLRAACEPCAECGHFDYRELDDILDPKPENSQERRDG
jgi:hypothetical protein